jgi:Spy/CpxP family protein refolding chaperone
MKHTTTLIVAFLALIATPSVVLAQNGGNAPDANDPVAVYKEAGINAQQESSIRKLAQEYDQESAVKLKALGGLLQELKTLAYQPVLDGNALLAKQEQINKLQSEMSIDRIQMVIKIRNILTANQNEKLANILQSRMREDAEQPGLK